VDSIAALVSGFRIDLLKVFYCFFPLASAFLKFSFTLNFTILLISLKGIGFPMEAAPNPLRRHKHSSSLNFSIPLGAG
jgi:hypothetical protein